MKSQLAFYEQIECYFNQLQELNTRMKTASCKGINCYHCPMRISNQPVIIKSRDNVDLQVICINNLIDLMKDNAHCVMSHAKYAKMIQNCIFQKEGD